MEPFAASSAGFLRRRVGTYVAFFLLTLAVFMLSVRPVWASSSSSSTMDLTSLTITPASGTVVFDPTTTTSEAFAQAQNSFGGFDQEYNSGLGTKVTSNAMTQFACGKAAADPVNLVLNSYSNVNIPNEPIGFVAASSQGTADIYNTNFMITGGTGSVNVTFDSFLKWVQNLATNINGINATSEVVFSLAINGTQVLFLDSPLMVGSNASASIENNNYELKNSTMLNYNEDYEIYIETDAESSGQSMPEPSTLALLFSGPALAFGRRWIMAKRG